MSEHGLVITTRSGAVYDIVDGHWWRNGRGGDQIMAVFGMPPEMTIWEAHGWDRYDIASIQVGWPVYFAGFDTWAMSTPVTEIVVKQVDYENVKEATE
jgi:hypothetical protein